MHKPIDAIYRYTGRERDIYMIYRHVYNNLPIHTSFQPQPYSTIFCFAVPPGFKTTLSIVCLPSFDVLKKLPFEFWRRRPLLI